MSNLASVVLKQKNQRKEGQGLSLPDATTYNTSAHGVVTTTSVPAWHGPRHGNGLGKGLGKVPVVCEKGWHSRAKKSISAWKFVVACQEIGDTQKGV